MQITQDLDKIHFVDIDKKETCAKCQQEIFDAMIVEARQFFQFFRQNIGFVESNRALFKFLYRNLYYLTSIIKLWKDQSIKLKFILTTRTALDIKTRSVHHFCILALTRNKFSNLSRVCLANLKHGFIFSLTLAQLTFTCPKSKIETL